MRTIKTTLWNIFPLHRNNNGIYINYNKITKTKKSKITYDWEIMKLFKRFVLLHLLNGRKKSKEFSFYIVYLKIKTNTERQQHQPTAPLNHKIYYLLNHCNKHLHFLCFFFPSTNILESLLYILEHYWFIHAEEEHHQL